VFGVAARCPGGVWRVVNDAGGGLWYETMQRVLSKNQQLARANWYELFAAHHCIKIIFLQTWRRPPAADQ